MAITYALLLILIAGIINGSFALPTKHVYKWKFENIWLQYALWSFVILPWVIAIIIVPQIFMVYKVAPWHLLLIMCIGGFIMGIGQVCFALALNMIGLGLGFVINIGLGIVLGFLLPLFIQHPQEVLTPFGYITLVGCLLAVIGLLYSHKAGKLNAREKHELLSPENKPKSVYTLGVVLAIIAGLASAGQNFSFSMTTQMQLFALHLGATPVGAANVMWPGFLLCTFIPYAIYMLFLNFKNRSFGHYVEKGTGKYYFFAIIMGAFWYGSLICYGKAAHLIGALGPLVGWPLFMVLIILSSNFWGWRSGEWTGSSIKVKRTIWLGLLFLIFSIVVLAYSTTFHS